MTIFRTIINRHLQQKIKLNKQVNSISLHKMPILNNFKNFRNLQKKIKIIRVLITHYFPH